MSHEVQSFYRPENGAILPDSRSTSLPTARKYVVSKLILGLYVFTIIGFSHLPELYTISNIAGFLLVLSFAIDTVIVRQRTINYPLEIKPLTAFFLVIFVSGLWAGNLSLWFTRTFTVFQLLMFAVVAINILQARSSVLPVAWGLLAGLALAALIAIRDNDFDLFTPHTYRPGSLFGNPNTYALYLLLGISICLYLLHHTHSKKLKMLLLFMILLYIHQIVFFSGSRKALVGLLIFFPIHVFFWKILLGNSSISQTIFWGCALIVLYLGLTWILEQTPYYYRLSQIETDLTERGRGQLIDFGLEKWKERPIVGFGGNQYRRLYAEAMGGGAKYSHNNYVEILVNNGLLGFFCFYLFFFIIVREAHILFRTGRASGADTAWVLALVVILLIWDFGAVTYYDKGAWIAYILLASTVISGKTRIVLQPQIAG